MNKLQSEPNSRIFHNERLPLFFYSYSSKGFQDIGNLISNTLQDVPMYLLSLYDYKYHIISEKNQIGEMINTTDTRYRIWDSGGYELLGNSNHETWNEQTYIETANIIPWNNKDILGSYDTPNEEIPLKDQIERALELYSKIEGTFYRNLLIHTSYDMDIESLTTILKPYIEDFHVLGFTEKEIAPTYVHGIRFIRNLRASLSAIQTKHYIPIHIFGCFDMKTVIRFTLAGADIFDGLTWLRYYFSNNEVLYKKELQYALSIGKLTGGDLENEMWRNNITEMNELRSHLVYSIFTDDFEKFTNEFSDINDLT